MQGSVKQSNSETHHKGIFELLLVATILMVLIFSVFAYVTFFSVAEEQNKNKANALPVANTEQVAPLNIERVESPVTKDTAPTNQTMKIITESGPTFNYPNNWHISTSERINDGLVSTTTFISSSPLFFCASCEGSPTNIQILSEPISGLQPELITVEEYIRSIHQNEFIHEITITKINETTFQIDGLEDGASDSTRFQKTYYIAGEYLFSLVRNNMLASTEEDAGYDLIKSTINFEPTK